MNNHVRGSLESLHIMPGRPNYFRLVLGYSGAKHPVSEVIINPASGLVTYDDETIKDDGHLLDMITTNRYIRVEFDFDDADTEQTTSGTRILVTIQAVTFTTCEDASEIA